jgi:hypothetical protein
MEPQPPPLDGWPQPLPPPLYETPPAPPPWAATTAAEASGQSHVVRWILGASALLAVAAVVMVTLVGWHPAGLTSSPAARATTNPTSPVIATAAATPSSTTVPAAVAEAGQLYLAAVAPVNADGDRFLAALEADEALPCTCSPGEFAVRADAIAVIPSIESDTEAMQVVLREIKHDVPALSTDIDAVVLDNQKYTGYLAAAYRASEVKNGAVGYDINEAEAEDQTSRPDFARLRSDLGLPPPPSS